MSELDFSLLPDDLRPLGPLISRYAVSDDVDRSDLLEQASDADLPIQVPAKTLDSFSQAAMEAKYELEKRDGG
jgi:hypothetical protein